MPTHYFHPWDCYQPVENGCSRRGTPGIREGWGENTLETYWGSKLKPVLRKGLLPGGNWTVSEETDDIQALTVTKAAYQPIISRKAHSLTKPAHTHTLQPVFYLQLNGHSQGSPATRKGKRKPMLVINIPTLLITISERRENSAYFYNSSEYLHFKGGRLKTQKEWSLYDYDSSEGGVWPAVSRLHCKEKHLWLWDGRRHMSHDRSPQQIPYCS